MPILIGAGVLLVGGLGAYLIHTASGSINDAVEQGAGGAKIGIEVLAGAVAVGIVIYAYNKSK